MPADLTPLDSDRNAIADLFGNPTGFGTRIINFMTRCFGASNVFGTAATRDASSVRTAGAVPVLDSERFIPFVQTPPATATRRGMVIDGSITSDTPDTMNVGGHDYPVAVNVHSLVGFYDRLLLALTAGGIDMQELPRRNYGPSNALKTSFVIPRQPCIIFISTNGGLSGYDPDAASGDDLAIVDSSGADIIRIKGGQGGNASQVRNSRVVNGRASNYIDGDNGLTFLRATRDVDPFRLLNLNFGIFLKGGGAQGGVGSDGDYKQAGDNGTLFIGFKHTEGAQTWLTDNPAPPHFDINSQAARTRYRNDQQSLGFAFYIRLR